MISHFKNKSFFVLLWGTSDRNLSPLLKTENHDWRANNAAPVR